MKEDSKIGGENGREKRLLEGKLFCKECSNRLTVLYRRNLDYWSVNCNRYSRDPVRGRCYSHFYPYNYLEEQVLEQINKSVSKLIKELDLKELNNEVVKSVHKETNNIDKTIKNLEVEKDTIKMNGICKANNEIEKYKDKLQLVDYTCTGNNTDNINLINYILELIEEGDNKKYLMPSNLEDFIYLLKEKEKSGEIVIPPNVTFILETLLRMRTFTMNDKNKKEFKAEKYKFNFNIEGYLDGNLTNNISFKGDLDLVEVDAKVNCKFSSDSDLNAHLDCNFNSENYKNIKTFSFKLSQISNKDNDIIISDLDKITLINTEEEKSFFEQYKLYILVGGPVLGAILIGASILIIYIIRKKRANRSNTFINMQESGMKNFNMPNMPNKLNKPNMITIPNMPNMNPNIQGNNMAESALSKTPITKIDSKKIRDKKKHDKKNKIKNKMKDKVKNKKKK